MTDAVAGTSWVPQPVYVLRGISKRYGGVRALTGVDLDVHPGRVHAIVGENGAGKSTLMKIMAGAERPDEGRLLLRSEEVELHGVKAANDRGVAIVFQELSLYPDLDVLANLFLQREPTRWAVLQRAKMRELARPVLEELALDVPTEVPVGHLKLSEQQLLEIAKALLADASVLIFDEPNSALNATESERLFDLVRGLRARGVAILFISHRLEEVFQIADVITVMRNGSVVTTLPREEATIPGVVSLMIGRAYSEVTRYRAPTVVEGPALRLEHLRVGRLLDDVSLVARPGEVLGLAGLEGSGVATVLDAVFGLVHVDAGTIVLPDGASGPHSVPDAIRAGIALVPADRREEGLALGQDVVANVSAVTAGALGRFGFVLSAQRMEERTRARVEDLNIVVGGLGQPVASLSGGNQQKVVIAKWLEADPRVVLLHDPTRGVDVGAKEEIYQIIGDLAADGRIVLFTSTELTEYSRLCDRVVVFYRGRVVGELAARAITTRDLLEAINTGHVPARGPALGTEVGGSD